MRLLVTEVTEMSAGNYCVAAWRASTQVMVRPLPNGGNWTKAGLLQHGIDPGASIDVQPTGMTPHGAYPHLTEKTHRSIRRRSRPYRRRQSTGWDRPRRPPGYPSIRPFTMLSSTTASGTTPAREFMCRRGTVVRSLAGIILPASSVVFTEEFDKLKALVDDGEAMYKLAVSCRAFKESWRSHGLQALNQVLPQRGELHIRLGLARAFGNPPDKCYMMVNGVCW